MLALTDAGSVGTRPVRGGLTGLLAGSVVAGYWQLEPSVAGGLNGGSWLSGGRRRRGEAGIVRVIVVQRVSRLRARITDEELTASNATTVPTPSSGSR